MADDKHFISLEQIINNITQNLEAEKVLRYDNHVRSVAEETFYGFATPNELTGIFECLINNWKLVHERSQLNKVLPIIITGKKFYFGKNIPKISKVLARSNQQYLWK